jgi:hypothetical protein
MYAGHSSGVLCAQQRKENLFSKKSQETEKDMFIF